MTRSISGHSTPEMQRLYSTVRGDEQREGLAKVVSLMKARERYHLDSKTRADSAPVESPSGTAGGTSPEASGTGPQAGQASSESAQRTIETP